MELLRDDAVLPDIVGILMVAITVILAAVIGTFVHGLGGQVQKTTRNAQLSDSQDTTEVLYDRMDDRSDDASDDWTEFQILHEGGDSLDKDNDYVTVNGDQAYEINTPGDGSTEAIVKASWLSGDEVLVGDSTGVIGYASSEGDSGVAIATTNQLAEGDTVRITWTAGGGDRSLTLFSEDVQ